MDRRASDDDVTRCKRAEEALRESEQNYRLLIENAGEAIFIVQDDAVKFPNPVAERLTGYSAEELARISWIGLVHPEDRESVDGWHGRRLRAEESPDTCSFRIESKAGEELWVELNIVRITWEGKPAILNFARDITPLKKLEFQLFTSQKMEVVGRLAGRIAHDFNNLLTVIIGYCDLSLGRLAERDPMRHDITEIRKASGQCAAMTRQLLAFSRKQILVPKVINLNSVVTDMDKMLRHLFKENIALALVLEKNLGNVKADPGQIEQVIMNLVVNSLDAMPLGGKINIETANVELDKAYARQHKEVFTGPYVMLAVNDTGCGMDEKTLSRIFEPFFTTKEKGTGLGLATVHGIVKQSGGSVSVYSEPGIGTTFKIFLPCVEEVVAREAGPIGTPRKELRGSETILLVEDEEMVRWMVMEVLERKGYKVLEARDGGESLRICEQHEGKIHLMLTDVVMPGMSGMELSKRVSKKQPEMKVLYMSGHADNTMMHHGIIEPGIHFIQKPFTIDLLASKVRQVLETNSLCRR